jgi:hypothetical protein
MVAFLFGARTAGCPNSAFVQQIAVKVGPTSGGTGTGTTLPTVFTTPATLHGGDAGADIMQLYTTTISVPAGQAVTRVMFYTLSPTLDGCGNILDRVEVCFDSGMIITE